MAAENQLLYERTPSKLQGRVFAARNFLQYGSIPVGILLGGALADYVFEPFMLGEISFALFLQRLIGNGPVSRMAVMFLCTGLTGFLFSLAIYLLLRRLKTENRL